MEEQELQQMLSQIPPEVILMIIQMVLNASPEELKQLIAELESSIQGGGGQQQRDGSGDGTGEPRRDGSGQGQGQQGDPIFG